MSSLNCTDIFLRQLQCLCLKTDWPIDIFIHVCFCILFSDAISEVSNEDAFDDDDGYSDVSSLDLSDDE